VTTDYCTSLYSMHSRNSFAVPTTSTKLKKTLTRGRADHFSTKNSTKQPINCVSVVCQFAAALWWFRLYTSWRARSTAKKEPFSSCDLEPWHDLDLRSLPGQDHGGPARRISRTKVISFQSYCPDSGYTRHTYPTDCSTWTTKVVGKCRYAST